MGDADLRNLAQRCCGELGVELWDLAWKVQSGRRHLIVTIDKPGGIGLDDCEVVSSRFGAELDQGTVVQGPYTLEVESPGPERRLRGPGDVSRYVGRQVRVQMQASWSGRRRFTGILCAGEDVATVRISGVDGHEHALPWSSVERLHLTGRD